MQNVLPCPYCGGEVEVVKLSKKPIEKKQPYRIECLNCRALVARGQGFPNESPSAAEKRLKQYDDYIQKTKLYKEGNRIFQTRPAQIRDYVASMSSRLDENDEEYEVHEAPFYEEEDLKLDADNLDFYLSLI